MDNDLSSMDWSPTPITLPARGVKRRSDGNLILTSPYTPYPRGYMPGGWPQTPPLSGIFDRPEPPKPDAFGKRICLGLSAAATNATTSMYAIVRRMRNIRPTVPRLNFVARRALARRQAPVALQPPPQLQDVVAPQTPPRGPLELDFATARTSAQRTHNCKPHSASTPIERNLEQAFLNTVYNAQQAASDAHTVAQQESPSVASEHMLNGTPAIPAPASAPPSTTPGRTPERISVTTEHYTESPFATPAPHNWPNLGDSGKWPVLKPDDRLLTPSSPPSPAAAQLQEELHQAAYDSESDSEGSIGLEDTWISTEPSPTRAGGTPAVLPTLPALQLTSPRLLESQSHTPTTPHGRQSSRSPAESDFSSNVPITPIPAAPQSPAESDISSNVPPTPVPAASQSPAESDISSTVPPTPDVSSLSPSFRSALRITSSTKASPSTPVGRATSTPKSESHFDRKTRAVSKRIAAAQDAQNFTLDPLPKDWEDKVDRALSNGHGSYTTHDFKKVVPQNSRESGTTAWLNDEVINGYLKVVCQHGNKDQKPGETPRYHAFSSFFMTNLLEKGVDSVKRWASRAKIGGKSLARVEKVFMPINSGAHWTLLVVSPSTKEITYYNSLPGGGSRYVRKALDWLQQEMGKDFQATEWSVTANAESPQQTNSSDCGVFTITSAKQIMLGHGVMTYTAADIKVQRRRIVAELVNGGLLRN